MAIQIVSGNLNQLGNAGAFETDRSTWGFGGNGAGIGFNRSLAYSHSGLYSAECDPSINGGVNRATLVPCRFHVDHDKNYLLKCWVYVPAASPIAADDYRVVINGISEVGVWSINKLVETSKTILEAKGVWCELQTQVHITVDNPANWPGGADLTFYAILVPPGATVLDRSGTLDTNAVFSSTGFLYIDDFEVYEYVEVGSSLAIHRGNTVIVNTSGPLVADGSIDVAITGGTGPFEFSKDGNVWQPGSLFENLLYGTYTMHVREVANPANADSEPFNVNVGASPGFGFIPSVTNESVPGANDGKILITVTGDGIEPYEYSKDSNAIVYQASNEFLNLAPGQYIISVKDSAGFVVSQLCVVGAGELIFQKAFFSKNFIPFEVNAQAGYEELVNYRIYSETRVEDEWGAGIYTAKLKQDLPPDTTGKATFNVRQAFRGLLKAEPPAYQSNGVQVLTDRIRFFKHYTGHLQNLNVVPAVLTASDPYLVVLGGIDKFHYPSINYFTEYMVNNKKFMTWAPLVKAVDRQQEDYLNFFVYNRQISLITVRAKVYFDDGTNEVVTITSAAGVKYGWLLQLPAGPTNTMVAAVNPAKTVTKYDLWLENQSNVAITEVRTYLINKITHPNSRFFMFLNSLGSYEVLLFTGQAQENTSFQREVLQKVLPFNYASIDGEFTSSEVIGVKRNSYSSGYHRGALSQQWQTYMEDFMLSTKIFLLRNAQRIPVVITGGDLTKEDQNYERFFRFEAKPAYDNVSYTPADV